MTFCLDSKIYQSKMLRLTLKTFWRFCLDSKIYQSKIRGAADIRQHRFCLDSKIYQSKMHFWNLLILSDLPEMQLLRYFFRLSWSARFPIHNIRSLPLAFSHKNCSYRSVRRGMFPQAAHMSLHSSIRY